MEPYLLKYSPFPFTFTFAGKFQNEQYDQVSLILLQALFRADLSAARLGHQFLCSNVKLMNDDSKNNNPLGLHFFAMAMEQSSNEDFPITQPSIILQIHFDWRVLLPRRIYDNNYDNMRDVFLSI